MAFESPISRSFRVIVLATRTSMPLAAASFVLGCGADAAENDLPSIAGTAGQGPEATGTGGVPATGGSASGASSAGGSPVVPDECATPSAEPTAGCADRVQLRLSYDRCETVRLLALAVYESDQTPTGSRDEIAAYLNAPSFDGGPSVREYLLAATSGSIDVEFEVAFVQLPEGNAAYAGDSTKYVSEAYRIWAADADPTSLSRDQEGELYPATVLALGGFIERPNQGFFRIEDGADTTYGIYSLTFFTDQTTVGVITHELGHSLFGFGEYYGFFADGRQAFGTGNFDSMATGFGVPYNPFVRSCRGWGRIIDIFGTPAGTRVELSSNSGVVLRYRDPARPSEYFLIEAVQKLGMYAEIPDEGLLVWHVDEAMEYQKAENTLEMHNQIGLVQADGLNEIENGINAGGVGDAFGPRSSQAFGVNTTPSSAYWDGSSSGLEISGIGEVGPTISFMIGSPGSAPTGELQPSACNACAPKR